MANIFLHDSRLATEVLEKEIRECFKKLGSPCPEPFELKRVEIDEYKAVAEELYNQGHDIYDLNMEGSFDLEAGAHILQLCPDIFDIPVDYIDYDTIIFITNSDTLEPDEDELAELVYNFNEELLESGEEEIDFTNAIAIPVPADDKYVFIASRVNLMEQAMYLGILSEDEESLELVHIKDLCEKADKGEVAALLDEYDCSFIRNEDEFEEGEYDENEYDREEYDEDGAPYARYNEKGELIN